MIIARLQSSGGKLSVALTYDDDQFLLREEELLVQEVRALDSQGLLEWVSDDVRRFVYAMPDEEWEDDATSAEEGATDGSPVVPEAGASPYSGEGEDQPLIVGTLDALGPEGDSGPYGAPRSITYFDHAFSLERDGALAGGDLLQYDREHRVAWVDDGLRDWARKLATTEEAKRAGVGSGGFIVSVFGFFFNILWFVSLVMCFLEIRRGRRENLRHGWAIAGFCISALMAVLKVIQLIVLLDESGITIGRLIFL